MIFQRVFSWLANEIITKQLANSKAFQRAATKLHETVQNSPLKQAVQSPPPPPRSYNPYRISEYPTEQPSLGIEKTVSSFVNVFTQTIKKEMNKIQKK